MKKIATFSLFVFVAIIFGVAFVYLFSGKNSKSNVGTTVGTVNITGVSTSSVPLVLSLEEIAKHNSYSSCWLLISGKVYDVTSYLNSHPGGEAEILKTCGTDATVIYDNRDNTGSHSSKARSMLADYYIGDFNQTIKVGTSSSNISNVVKPTSVNQNKQNRQNREWDDD